MIRKTISMALAAALLTGCTLIPGYTRPEAPVPADWPSGPAYKNDQSGRPGRIDPPAADLQWRLFFSGDRLQRIISMALDNNRDLRVAVLNVERARALYRVQRAELLPTVDGAFR